jgi:multiple sugar transport system substrate-binding protein
MLTKRTRAAALATAAVFVSSGALAQDAVRVTVAYYSAATGPYFEKMASEFEAANPGTDIQIEVVNWDTLQQKLTTDIAGGTNSDLAIIGTRWLVEYVQSDLVEPLDGYMDDAFRQRFIGTFLSPGQIESVTYGLPIAASARAMYYNKDLFAAAGVAEPPKTWDEVETAAAAIKASGAYGFGLQGKEIETDVYFYYPFWSYGGELLDAEGKSGVSSDAGVQALTLYKSLIDEGLTQPEPTGNSREDVQNLFKQGRVGMMITAPFLAAQIKAEAPDLQYGIVPVPSGTTQATYAVTDSIIMFKNSANKETAWKFLDYVFTGGPRIEFTKQEGFLPTTVAEASDPYFADNAELKVFVDLLPNAKFAPLIANWEGMAAAVSRQVQAVYLGQAEPKAALEAAAAEANAAIGK